MRLRHYQGRVRSRSGDSKGDKIKVRDLLRQIEDCRDDYGDDFLDWSVFTEQLDITDRQSKKTNPQWKWLTDSEGWEYIECAGFWTIFSEEKAFTINVNY